MTVTLGKNFICRVDELSHLMQRANAPLSIVLFPSGKMPAGNAIVHLKRLMQVVSNSDKIAHFIVVNDKGNIIRQHMGQLAMKTFGDGKKLHMVRSEEDAYTILTGNSEVET